MEIPVKNSIVINIKDSIKILLLPLFIFTVLVLYIASSPLRFHSDERHYLEAVLNMMEQKNYIVPVDFRGSPRLIKPVLPYWNMIVGIKIVGISPLGMRLSNIILAFITLASIWAGTLLIAGEYAAIIATCLLMSNFIFINSSTIAIPDMLVCAGITLSWFGTISIILNSKQNLYSYWFYYPGAAIAIASKGMLGMFFIFYTPIFCKIFLNIPLKRFCRFMPVITFFIIAGFWYVVMSFFFKGEFWMKFLYDQTAGCHGISLINFISNILLYSAVIIISFWWIIPIVRRSTIDLFCIKSSIILYTIIWIGINIVIFSLAPSVRPRYLLPSIPLLCSITGYLLSNIKISSSFLEQTHKLLLKIAFTTLIIVTVVFSVIAFQLDKMAALLEIYIAVIFAILPLLFISNLSNNRYIFSIICSYILICTIFIIFCIHVFIPTCPEKIIASFLMKHYPDTTIKVIDSEKELSLLRLYTKNTIKLNFISSKGLLTSDGNIREGIYLYSTDKILLLDVNENVTLTKGIKTLKPLDFVLSLFKWKLKEYISSKEVEYILARKGEYNVNLL